MTEKSMNNVDELYECIGKGYSGILCTNIECRDAGLSMFGADPSSFDLTLNVRTDLITENQLNYLNALLTNESIDDLYEKIKYREIK